MGTLSRTAYELKAVLQKPSGCCVCRFVDSGVRREIDALFSRRVTDRDVRDAIRRGTRLLPPPLPHGLRASGRAGNGAHHAGCAYQRAFATSKAAGTIYPPVRTVWPAARTAPPRTISLPHVSGGK